MAEDSGSISEAQGPKEPLEDGWKDNPVVALVVEKAGGNPARAFDKGPVRVIASHGLMGHFVSVSRYERAPDDEVVTEALRAFGISFGTENVVEIARSKRQRTFALTGSEAEERSDA